MRVRSSLSMIALLGLVALACRTDGDPPSEATPETPNTGDGPAGSDPTGTTTTGDPTKNPRGGDAGGGGDGRGDDGGGPGADASTTPDASTEPPRPDDGIKNGTETDTDCGGPEASTPRCGLYKTCLAKSDCAQGDCFASAGGASKCQLAPSCTGAPGTHSCGLKGDEDCCIALPVPGGNFNRQGDVAQPTTVSGFTLDKYEITVGRVRAYFNATGGNPKGSPPPAGGGLHPKVPNSGWRSSFNVRLP